MKKILLLLIAAMLVLNCTAALAAKATASTGSYAGELTGVTPFKFEHFKNGIGRGTCPVYTAPYSNAYRCADGKASVSTNSYIDLGGFSEQGWLLVRYTTNSGSTRVGVSPSFFPSTCRYRSHSV